MLFTEALTLVQHELPRSKVGAHACAEITAYVDGLNTEFEKMCAEQKDLIANDDSMHQQLLLSSTAVGAHEEMKQKVEELEATLIKKDTDNTTLETSRLADQTTNCVYTRTPSIPVGMHGYIQVYVGMCRGVFCFAPLALLTGLIKGEA